MEISIHAKEIRNAYQRRWRRKNSDKVRTYHAKYWNKKAEEDQDLQVDDLDPDQISNIKPDLVEPLTQEQKCQMNDLFADLKSRSEV